jgi:hypothetical protein
LAYSFFARKEIFIEISGEDVLSIRDGINDGAVLNEMFKKSKKGV